MGEKLVYDISELRDDELDACRELLDYLDEDTSEENIDHLFDMDILSLYQDGETWYVIYRKENEKGEPIKEAAIRIDEFEIIKI